MTTHGHLPQPSNGPQRTELRTGGTRIRARCACGGLIDTASNPPEAAEGIYRLWASWHEGSTHRLLQKGERRPLT